MIWKGTLLSGLTRTHLKLASMVLIMGSILLMMDLWLRLGLNMSQLGRLTAQLCLVAQVELLLRAGEVGGLDSVNELRVRVGALQIRVAHLSTQRRRHIPLTTHALHPQLLRLRVLVRLRVLELLRLGEG